MNVINDYPPNIGEIKKAFDLTGKRPIFTYGNTIYNPHNCSLETHLHVHEEVHMKQQKEMGMFLGVRRWWTKYLNDPEFRLSQEIEAYRAQYQYVKKVVKDRNKVAKFLSLIASDLASPMYGNLLNTQEAIKLIQKC